MGLQENMYSLIENYNYELQEARRNDNYKRPFADLVRRDIAEKIRLKLNNGIYKVKGSVGAGRWTDVPWIAVFDSRITKSAQKGVYIVYLLNKDTKELYLTLNQGATDVAQGGNGASKLAFTGIASSSSAKATENLKIRAADIRKYIGEFAGLKSDPINTGSKVYDAGCIYYKKYSLESLPEDAELYRDLDLFVTAYQAYYEKVFVSSKSEGTNEKSEDNMSTEEVLSDIVKYITSKGFVYEEKLLENFYLSLKVKPFVLLAGTSGTGKTRLVRLFAEAIGAYWDGRYKQIAVKPDWSDSTDLFGHVNLENKFVPGAIVEFINKAADDPQKLPYILCLDEMNLARVEYYFSDFLSVIETRDWNGEEIITDKLVPKSCYAGDTNAEGLYSDMIIPENLYIVGTVNMDETTFPFSKKVLDRANTIEFSKVDFDLPDAVDAEDVDPILVGNDFLRSKYLKLRIDCSDSWEAVKKINEKIKEINEILEKEDAHFGYRMRDEIIFYMLYNDELELISENEAFDNQIMQKVLPRIQGSSESIANLLRELFILCAGPFSNKSGETDARKMKSYLSEGGTAYYPKSANKICMMLRRYEDNDFTSFWI